MSPAPTSNLAGFEEKRIREFIQALHGSLHVQILDLNEVFIDALVQEIITIAEHQYANGEIPQLSDFTSWIINKLREQALNPDNENLSPLERPSSSQPQPPRPGGGSGGGGPAPPGPGGQNPPPLPPGPPAENAKKLAKRAKEAADAAANLSGAERQNALRQAAEFHDLARRSANAAAQEAREAKAAYDKAKIEAEAADKAAVDYAQARQGRDWTQEELEEAARLNNEAARTAQAKQQAKEEAERKAQEAQEATEASNEAAKKINDLVNPEGEESSEEDQENTPNTFEISLVPETGPAIEGLTPINPPPWLPVVPQPPSGRGILVHSPAGQLISTPQAPSSYDDCIKKIKDCAKHIREGLLSGGQGTGTTGALQGGGSSTHTGTTDGGHASGGKCPCDPCDPNVMLAGLLEILADAAAARLSGGQPAPSGGGQQQPSGPGPSPTPPTPPPNAQPTNGQPPDDTNDEDDTTNSGNGNGSGSSGQPANSGTPPAKPDPSSTGGSPASPPTNPRQDEDPPRSIEEIEGDIKKVEESLENAPSSIRPRLIHSLNTLYRELLRARGVKGIEEGTETLVPGDEILTSDGNVHPVYRTFQVLVGNRGFAVTKINGKHVVTTVRKTVTLDNGEEVQVWDFSKARALQGQDWEVIELLSIHHWKNMAKRMIYSSETVGKDFIDAMLEEAEQNEKTTTTLQADMTAFIFLSHFYGGIDFVRPNPGDSYRAGQKEMDMALDPNLSTGERIVHGFGAFGYAVLTVVEVVPIPGASAADEVVAGMRSGAKKLEDVAETLARRADEATTPAQRKAAEEAAERMRRQAAEMQRKADELAEAIKQSRRAAMDAASRVRGCFSPETLILLSDGSKKEISKLKKGERILSAKAHGRDVVETEVEKVWRVHNTPVLELNLESTKTPIHVTRHHRVATPEGYKPAQKLKAGDVLLSRGGSEISIKSVAKRGIFKDVYNLQINKEENYFVGDAELLVHNDCLEDRMWSEVAADLEANGFTPYSAPRGYPHPDPTAPIREPAFTDGTFRGFGHKTREVEEGHKIVSEAQARGINTNGWNHPDPATQARRRSEIQRELKESQWNDMEAITYPDHYGTEIRNGQQVDVSYETKAVPHDSDVYSYLRSREETFNRRTYQWEDFSNNGKFISQARRRVDNMPEGTINELIIDVSSVRRNVSVDEAMGDLQQVIDDVQGWDELHTLYTGVRIRTRDGLSDTLPMPTRRDPG